MSINVERILADALIELNKEKPLHKITVTEIVQRAGTGRGTFYNHFRDKNDLIYWIFLHTLSGERRLVETQGYFPYLVKLHQEATKIKGFLMQACKLVGQNSLSEAIYQQNYRYYKKCFVRHLGQDKVTDEVEFALKFNAYAASNMYMEWVISGMGVSPELQSKRLLRCMPKIIRDVLPLRPEEWEE